MQSGKTRGDVLVTITERLSRQHIVRHVSGRNSQAVTRLLLGFSRASKMLNQLQLITVESLQNMMR